MKLTNEPHARVRKKFEGRSSKPAQGYSASSD